MRGKKSWKFVAVFVAAAFLVGLPLAWKYTPLSEWATIENGAAWFSTVRSSDYVALWIGLFYVAGALLFMPILLFIFLTALFFDNPVAYVFVLYGVTLNILTGYGVGYVWGTKLIRSVDSKTMSSMADEVSGAGFVDLFLFRLIPITPFPTMNMLCGAIRMPFLRFYGATLASLAPGAILIIVFERSAIRFLRNMTWQSGLLFAVTVGVIVGSILYLRNKKRGRSA